MNLPAVTIASVKNTAANHPATIDIPSTPESRLLLLTAIWSYSRNPVGGKLTVVGGPTPVEFDITDQGPGHMDLSFYVCDAGKNLIVTLASGGPNVIGKLNLAYSTRRY